MRPDPIWHFLSLVGIFLASIWLSSTENTWQPCSRLAAESLALKSRKNIKFVLSFKLGRILLFEVRVVGILNLSGYPEIPEIRLFDLWIRIRVDWDQNRQSKRDKFEEKPGFWQEEAV